MFGQVFDQIVGRVLFPGLGANLAKAQKEFEGPHERQKIFGKGLSANFKSLFHRGLGQILKEKPL